jgi:hypothetical protein
VFQERGDAARLVTELGSNYGVYHALADQLERCGGAPDPAEYGGDLGRYEVDCTLVLEILRAESVLRSCRVARGSGTPAPGAPLVDGAHRLVAAEGADEARQSRRGSARARAWEPPVAPPCMRRTDSATSASL